MIHVIYIIYQTSDGIGDFFHMIHNIAVQLAEYCHFAIVTSRDAGTLGGAIVPPLPNCPCPFSCFFFAKGLTPQKQRPANNLRKYKKNHI